MVYNNNNGWHQVLRDAEYMPDIKNMFYPKISIVTPNYNLGQFLEQTIISVLSQGYPNLEYIIIDGGSTDNSLEIIEKYAEYLAFWISEPDTGMYNAINKGFAIASGDIFAWLNSDDVYFPGSLFLVGELFSKFSNVDWITSNIAHIDDRGYVVYTDKAERLNQITFLTGKIKWIQQESTFWRRELFDKMGGKLNENYKLAADYALWAEFFKYSKLYGLSTCLSGFRIRSVDQKSVDNLEGYISEVKMIRANYSFDKNKYNQYLKCRKYFNLLNRLPLLKLILKRKFLRLRSEVEKAHPRIIYTRKGFEIV